MKPPHYTPRPDPNHAPLPNPFNAVSPVIVVVALAILGVELLLDAGAFGLAGGRMGVGWRIAAVEDWGFAPGVLDRLVQARDVSPDILMRFVTYAFVHGSFTHMLFGAALLLALGKFVGEVLHPLALAGLLLASTVLGALAFGALAPGNPPLIGIYPAVYGLIGGFTYLTWLRLGQMGQNQLAAFRLIGVLLAIQLVFGLVLGSDPSWIAEVAGFASGLALCPFLIPGGWTATLRRLRRR
ncbi:rhomboid family intramembrane serine protease [Pseudoroseicyclus aestuarii]|uniref:Rhomboid family protein n=1 Tax=Pseudoroseicyclus aestuarii TaxID=1795041 RepID=A0A318SWN0_9RHOB|nr:rhomboid family intramembrane serine protease [Pseudoroseicyclus aestuarii]PYE84786.1 rhomboid family protein [Pseudoroseicyclus aestuarii]